MHFYISICKNKFNESWCVVAFPKLLQEYVKEKQFGDQTCYYPSTRIEFNTDYNKKIQYIYPNTYDVGKNDYPDKIVPESNFSHFISIPFNNNGDLLRIYADKDANSKNESISILRLVRYNSDSGNSELIGDIQSEVGGNWAGIHVPIAITKDNKNIILEAYMGDPGAGGGSVTLGYAYLPFSSGKGKCGYLVPNEISDYAYFYDGFSKSLFYVEGDNTPKNDDFTSRSYDSAIKYYNTTTGESKVILDELNSIYKITGIDEKAGVFYFKSCSWQKYKYTCDTNLSTKERSMVLP